MNSQEFERRRQRLCEAMDPRSVALLPTAPVRPRSRDTEFPFRPDSDFYYLTGFAEPEAVAVLRPDAEQGRFVLFCRERDPEREQWDGYRAGLEGACERFGADDAFPIGDIDDILPGMLEGCHRLYYAMGCYPEFDQQVMGWLNRLRRRVRSGASAPGEFVALDHVLHDMRLYKSAAELKVMRRAMAISAQAHERAMALCKPGLFEYQVEAELVHESARAGARAMAYPSIVAGGSNACVLHYIDNRDRLQDGDLLLIDAGCEYDYYASDITRTFPVGSRFSAPQRAVYDVVLEAQAEAIAATRAGNCWNDPHEAAVRTITRGLIDLGVIDGPLDDALSEERYKPYYMHRTGHWLGMDVHDVGDYKIDGEWRMLEPGMVMTVEPGIYIKPDADEAPAELRGIGIRIEDDVLVTREEPEVLTAGVAKRPEDIEALVGSRLS